MMIADTVKHCSPRSERQFLPGTDYSALTLASNLPRITSVNTDELLFLLTDSVDSTKIGVGRTRHLISMEIGRTSYMEK